LIRLIEGFELLKPENMPPPNTAKIQAKYNEEIIAILDKSFEMAKKYTSQSLTAMQTRNGKTSKSRHK